MFLKTCPKIEGGLTRREKKMSRKDIFMLVLLIIGFGSLIAYADISDLDRIICNGNETCLQEMKLGKINEEIDSTKQDLQMATESLGYMNHYDGIWPRTEESRNWYQAQKEFVCSTNEKIRHLIPQIKHELETLHSSTHPGISNRASLKLQEMQTDDSIQFFLTEIPCSKAKELCQKFL